MDATTLEGAKQTIAVGPVASQLAIKMLGTNGGGFFNVNSAHPFENPDAISNLIQMVSIFAIGAALTNVFGRMVGNQRQGWAIFAVMGILFVAGVVLCYWAEAAGNPLVHALGIDGGNMEGKETRFGIVLSALFAVVTTAASCGAVNAMHDSFMATRRHDPAYQHDAGRSDLRRCRRGSLRYPALRDHRGLRRWPDGWPYAGISWQEDRGEGSQDGHAGCSGLPLSMLGFTAIATVLPSAVASIANPGPHGFSEILYAYTSAAANNGSAFGGLYRQHALVQHHPRPRDVDGHVS